MTDLETSTVERSILLSVDVTTDTDLATIHEALSRTAAGYILSGHDSRVYVVTDDEDDE